MQRDLDVVIFGATGDTGVAGCCFLYFRGRRLGISRWAPAARNLHKLKTDVLDKLSQAPGLDGVAFSEPIQADAEDHDSLLRMCKRTKCVVACAGPFARYGEGVVKACIEAGTNYVDITGELPWVEKMEQRYGEEALQKGVTLVSMAGYDSVPPDLTTFLAAKGLKDAGESLARFDVFCGGDGVMPTGTIETVCDMVDGAKSAFLHAVSCSLLGQRRQKPVRAQGAGERMLPRSSKPYVPKEATRFTSNLIFTMIPGYSRLGRTFCLPHFMAPVNVGVVHRTAYHEGYPGLVYRERLGPPFKGLIPMLVGIVAGICVAVFFSLPYATSLLRRFVASINQGLMKKVRARMFAGYSPTGKTMADGVGISESGTMMAKVGMSCEYDPGLSFTMLSACVVAGSIVKKLQANDRALGGFQTAVTAVGGEVLADALRAAGVAITVAVQRA
mmetsp:Transcript_58252/g.151730  ORF Transcript_58252/g.151730 Transcript_58252/m.151730 type:complete len:444 (+) Transcript_58252:68-1399(+)